MRLQAFLLLVVGACALPDPALRGGGDLVQLSAGGARTCGLDGDGLVFCWGQDGTTGKVLVPTQVVLGLRRLTHVSVGHDYSCAVVIDADPVCWSGVNGAVYELAGAPTLDRIVVGRFPCGVTADGAIWCWLSGSAAPTEVGAPGALTGLAIDAFACALTPTGNAWCWGGPFATTPVAVLDSIAWSQIVPMFGWACGVPVGGSARCFTVAANGTVGAATAVNTAPIADGTKYVQVAGEGDRVALISDGGRVYFRTLSAPTPLPEGSALDWIWIDGGSAHTCGELADGRRACFWMNDWGQLGDGTTTFRANATEIGGGAP